VRVREAIYKDQIINIPYAVVMTKPIFELMEGVRDATDLQNVISIFYCR